QDAVGCIAFDERIRTQVPQKTKRSHLNSIITALAARDPADKTDLAAILRTAAESYPRRGVVVVISDLLVDRAGFFRDLDLLRQYGHDVLIFHVMDDEELDFPFSGPTRFEGLELADHLSCNPRALREGYLAALDRFLTEVRRGCVQGGVDYALLHTSDPLDA